LPATARPPTSAESTLQSIALNDRGFDYSTPAISLTGGGGSGATASATSSPELTLHGNRGIIITANGGFLQQTEGSIFSIGGPISSSGNGLFTTSGPGTLVLSGPNTYTGGTIVSAGLLAVTGAAATLGSGNVIVQYAPVGSALLIDSGVANAIDDNAALRLLGGGTPDVGDQGFAHLSDGITEVIGSLVLNGVTQANGITYGSTASSALVRSDEYFEGTGVL
jgi:autotransporter-associated beta strand protein